MNDVAQERIKILEQQATDAAAELKDAVEEGLRNAAADMQSAANGMQAAADDMQNITVNVETTFNPNEPFWETGR